MIKDEFTLPFFFSAKNKMSFIYQKLRDRERTYIKEKVKSRDKYTCSEFSNDPVEKTDLDQVKHKTHKFVKVVVTSVVLYNQQK